MFPAWIAPEPWRSTGKHLQTAYQMHTHLQRLCLWASLLMLGGSASSQVPPCPCDTSLVWFTDAEATQVDQWVTDAHVTKRNVVNALVARTKEADAWRVKSVECDSARRVAMLRAGMLDNAWAARGNEIAAKDRKIAALKPWKVGGIVGLVLLLSNIIFQLYR